jgi:uncharacterized protein
MSLAEARLCAACGLCCNGVIFAGMRLQPEDSARRLAVLGLRAKKRKEGLFLGQPCPAHDGSGCRIYADRPARCRAFVCRQLKEVASGQADESSALEKIGRARSQVSRVMELMEQAGEVRLNKPLAVRYAAVFTAPLEEGDGAARARDLLREEMAELTAIIRRDFYTEMGELAGVESVD